MASDTWKKLLMLSASIIYMIFLWLSRGCGCAIQLEKLCIYTDGCWHVTRARAKRMVRGGNQIHRVLNWFLRGLVTRWECLQVCRALWEMVILRRRKVVWTGLGGLLSLASWGVCTLFDKGISASGFIWKFLARTMMVSVQSERSTNKTEKNRNNNNNHNGIWLWRCNWGAWDGEKRPGGSPSQKHLLMRERQSSGQRSFPFSLIPFFLWIVHGTNCFHHSLD